MRAHATLQASKSRRQTRLSMASTSPHVLHSSSGLHGGTSLARQSWPHHRPGNQRLGLFPGPPSVHTAHQSITACRSSSSSSSSGDGSGSGSGKEGEGGASREEERGEDNSSGSSSEREAEPEAVNSNISEEGSSERKVDPTVAAADATSAGATSATEISEQVQDSDTSGPRSTGLQLRSRRQGAGKARQARQRVGYHPLEDLGVHERGGRGGAFAKRQLSNAEVARTVAEVRPRLPFRLLASSRCMHSV